jgi:glycosyltransferase involved in cell wall biosynthesis
MVYTFTLLYSGNIGENHDLETVIKAAAALDDSANVTVLIIGEDDKKDKIVGMAEAQGLRGSRIQLHP